MQGTQWNNSLVVLWPDLEYSDFSLQVLTTRMHGGILPLIHTSSLCNA